MKRKNVVYSSALSLAFSLSLISCSAPSYALTLDNGVSESTRIQGVTKTSENYSKDITIKDEISVKPVDKKEDFTLTKKVSISSSYLSNSISLVSSSFYNSDWSDHALGSENKNINLSDGVIIIEENGTRDGASSEEDAFYRPFFPLSSYAKNLASAAIDLIVSDLSLVKNGEKNDLTGYGVTTTKKSDISFTLKGGGLFSSYSVCPLSTSIMATSLKVTYANDIMTKIVLEYSFVASQTSTPYLKGATYNVEEKSSFAYL